MPRRRANGQFGLLDLLAIGMGSTIAAGIFVISAPAINFGGESVLLSIAIGAVLALISAVCLTQMSSVVSGDGGMYEYSRTSIPVLGFSAGIAAVSSLLCFASTMAIRVVTYVNGLFLGTLPVADTAAISIALVIIAALIAVSRLRFSVRLMQSFIALSVIALLVALFFGAGSISSSNYSFSINMSNYVNVLLSSGLFFLAFSGFAVIGHSRSQAGNSDKTLKKATFLSIIMLVIVYSLFAMAMIAILLNSSVGNISSLLELHYLGSQQLVIIMAAVRTLAVFGAVLLCLFIASKILQSMAENREVIYSLKLLNYEGKPSEGIVLCLFICLMLMLLVASGQLLYFASGLMLLAFILVEISALDMAFRKRHDAKVKTSLMGKSFFSVIPILGIAGNLVVLSSFGAATMVTSTLILALSLFHFKYVRPHLPKKSTGRNPEAFAGNTVEFTKD